MTTEEAITYAKRLAVDYGLNDETQAFCDMTIKALEALDKLDSIIVEQLDESTDQKECMTLRWVLDKMSEVSE